ncbi:hypothetical protein [Diaphorobacter limosus]|uniref:Lipoprotein n=1 Tax=Diaphorobacter limosus TaxID=3036128 RepID=A0ABZ0J9F5_9BURK|nr:hypothetical protein [Diaphorobacter sp. Y-1]WOO33787.1 hypothetical protein P4826_06920 [Diaphorobacter sp. Y-1]
MSLMHHPLLRIASAGVLGALMAGCVGVPGDPYYDGGYSGGGYYPGSASVTVYEQPGVIYTPPPVGWRNYPPPPHGWREDAWRERQWREHREREARERREHERRDMERRRDFERRDAERQREAMRHEAERRRELERQRHMEPHAHQPRVPQCPNMDAEAGRHPREREPHNEREHRNPRYDWR